MIASFRFDRGVALILLTGLVVAGAAAAQNPAGSPAAGAPATAVPPVASDGGVRAAIAARIKALDSDADGRISAAEHDAIGQNAFAKMDRDGNGNVSVAEIDAMRSAAANAQGLPTAVEVMARVDSDGDGQLSAAEHADGSHAMFGKMDGDGDGYITQAEMEAAHAAMSQPGN